MTTSAVALDAAQAQAATRRRNRQAALGLLAPWLLCLALTLAAYGGSLHGGIMFDAALDLPRASNRSWLEILTSAGASPYYRPVTLLLWKACFVLLGRNDLLLLHALSLASHVACGWLVYQLGRRLLDGWAGAVAAALFLWFPPSYQVVGFVDSIFHSLLTGFVLAAVVLYWDARKIGSRTRYAGALLATGLALFTHESAVVLPALILGIELLARRRLTLRWIAPFALEVAAFGAVWLAVPRWPSRFQLDLASLPLNAEYFFQGLVEPAVMQFGHLLAMGLLALGALLAIAVWRRRLAVAGFGLLWFAAAALPSVLLLPWANYVIDAPRLLYFGSAGIALVWAAALSPAMPLSLWGKGSTSVFAHGQRFSAMSVLSHENRAASMGAIVIVALILAQSYIFIGPRVRLLEEGASAVQQVVDAATKLGPDAGRTYVNVPAFIGPKQEELPLGHYGVTMLPDYFGLDLTVAALRGASPPLASWSYDDLAKPWDEAYGFHGHHAGLNELQASFQRGGGVYVMRFEPGRLRLEYAGEIDRQSTGHTLAHFGDWAVLEQASASARDGQLRLHLVWRALKAAPADYTVFVHVVGAAPQPLAQSDGYPIAGMLPPNRWQPGNVIYDERTISLPTGAHAKVLVGLYDRANPNHRAAATDAAGKPIRDDAVTVSL